MITVVVVLVFVSIFFAMWSVYRLIQDGWELRLKIKNVLPYVKENKSLGVASGVKFFGSNLMRYFVAFQFGVSTLGFLTPVFYGLTALSNIATIFDNIFSPKIVKRIETNGVFSIGQNKKEMAILLLASIFIFLCAILFSAYYYGFFFAFDPENYHHLLIIFSIGWFFLCGESYIKGRFI